jgi:hypothetical protein
MTDRISLDSELWEQDLWTGVDDPRPLLERLTKSDCPDPETVNEMLEGTFYVDFPSPHFFYLIPYVVDLFERQTESLSSPIKLFCFYMHRSGDGKPAQRCIDQLESQRGRIVDVLTKSLSLLKKNSEFDRDDYQQLLAGLATAYGQSDLGRQIYGIDPHTPIN